LLLGCDQSVPPLHPEYSEPYINGYVYRIVYSDSTSEYDRDFEVVDNRGLRMVPVVRLSGWPMPVYYYSATKYLYGDANYTAPLYRYELNVEHYWGEAFARVTMPADFAITRPGERYILGMDSTLVVTWRRAQAAQWYWFSLWITYDYLDTLGEWDSRDVRMDTLVFDTTLSFGPERIFPPEVMIVTEGDAIVDVWCGNGPAVEPGDRGNIRGIGHGFFYAISEPPDGYFYVGAPPLVRRCPERAAQQERFRALLRSRFGAGG
jgi:hypothetical protein